MLLRQVLSKFKIIGIIKEQLRNDKIGSRIDFVLEPLPIHVLSFFARNMAFRETGHSNGKTVLLPDELYQLIGKLETSGRYHKRAASRWISRKASTFLTPSALICANR